jgi:hypothetical protein
MTRKHSETGRFLLSTLFPFLRPTAVKFISSKTATRTADVHPPGIKSRHENSSASVRLRRDRKVQSSEKQFLTPDKRRFLNGREHAEARSFKRRDSKTEN